MRNAIARFDQVENVSDAERDEAWKRILRAADRLDVEVEAQLERADQQLAHRVPEGASRGWSTRAKRLPARRSPLAVVRHRLPRRLTKLVRVLVPGLLGGFGGRVRGILSDLLSVLDGV